MHVPCESKAEAVLAAACKAGGDMHGQKGVQPRDPFIECLAKVSLNPPPTAMPAVTIK